MILMVFSKEIVSILFGKEYLPAYICVVITAPIIIFTGYTNTIGLQIFYPHKQEKLIYLY